MRRGTGSQSILIRSVAVATATVFALTGFAVAQLGGLLPLPDINPAPIVSTGEIDPVLSSVLQSAAEDPLTPREREVLQLIAEGKTTKEVATILGISFNTAESHRNRIMKKLNIHETAGLVRYAIRRGLTSA